MSTTGPGPVPLNHPHGTGGILACPTCSPPTPCGNGDISGRYVCNLAHGHGGAHMELTDRHSTAWNLNRGDLMTAPSAGVPQDEAMAAVLRARWNTPVRSTNLADDKSDAALILASDWLADLLDTARAEARERIALAIEALPLVIQHVGIENRTVPKAAEQVRADAARLARADRLDPPDVNGRG